MFDFSNYTINFYLCSMDELIFIILVLSVIQIIFFCSIIELIWPTHFFNKRHNIDAQLIRWRTYTEFFLKLRSNSLLLNFFNKTLFKYYKF